MHAANNSTRAVWMGAPNALEMIYGPDERTDIAKLVTVAEKPNDEDALQSAEVVFGSWGMPLFDEALLARAPNLKLVLYGAGSVRGFVTNAVWQRGLRLASSWRMNAIPVSEFTVAAMIFSLKRAFRYAGEVRRTGRFPAHGPVPGAYRSTVGLVSLGAIGRMVCEKLRQYDLRLLAYDPYVPAADAAALGVTLVSLERLFEESDVVSLHTPWLKATERMIRGTHLSRMRRDATFINTARGAVVAEDEMIAVLKSRPDLQAVLDVAYPEPPIAGSPLYSLPNVFLTPHIAGSMGNECRRMGRCMVSELERYLTGQPLVHEVTPATMESMA